MTRVEVGVLINRPPDEVFSYLSNFENNPLWQSGVQEATITSEGALDVGSTYTQVSKFLGRRIESRFEVVEYEPNRRVKAQSVESSFPITFTRAVEAEGDSTRVTAVIEGDATGFFKLAGPLLDRMTQRQIEADYANLKTVLETQSGTE